MNIIPGPNQIHIQAPTTVSIIGSAGRDAESLSLLNADSFEKMVETAQNILGGIVSGKPHIGGKLHLVSGGAAWSDHVAVRLFAKGCADSLTLHLPCKLDGNKFYDSGSYSYKTNPGRSANKYHAQFSKAIGNNSIGEIHEAIENGAKVVVHNGFFARNNSVAKSDHIIAFTKSTTNTPAKGGTLHTWNKVGNMGKRYHISLKMLATI